MTIWLKVPPELKLLGTTLIGAGYAVTSAESISAVKALRSLGFMMTGGFFGMLIVFKISELSGSTFFTLGNFWIVGPFAAYYGDRFWKAAAGVSIGAFLQEYLKQKINGDK